MTCLNDLRVTLTKHLSPAQAGELYGLPVQPIQDALTSGLWIGVRFGREWYATPQQLKSFLNRCYAQGFEHADPAEQRAALRRLGPGPTATFPTRVRLERHFTTKEAAQSFGIPEAVLLDNIISWRWPGVQFTSGGPWYIGERQLLDFVKQHYEWTHDGHSETDEETDALGRLGVTTRKALEKQHAELQAQLAAVEAKMGKAAPKQTEDGEQPPPPTRPRKKKPAPADAPAPPAMQQAAQVYAAPGGLSGPAANIGQVELCGAAQQAVRDAIVASGPAPKMNGKHATHAVQMAASPVTEDSHVR